MAAKGTKKTSVTTELVLGQAAQNITRAITELNTAIESVNTLSSKAEELTLIVSNKEQSIEELEITYQERDRQLEVDLELRFKANVEGLVTEYLNETEKVSISRTELNDLRNELTATKAGIDTQVKKEVAIATNSLKSHYENSILLANSEHARKEAENLSKIGTLEEKNKFLEGQVTKMYQQMDAERAASIERAKASSVGTIQVGTNSSK